MKVRYKNINTGVEYEAKSEEAWKKLKANKLFGKAFQRLTPKKATAPPEVKPRKAEKDA